MYWTKSRTPKVHWDPSDCSLGPSYTVLPVPPTHVKSQELIIRVLSTPKHGWVQKDAEWTSVWHRRWILKVSY